MGGGWTPVTVGKRVPYPPFPPLHAALGSDMRVRISGSAWQSRQ